MHRFTSLLGHSNITLFLGVVVKNTQTAVIGLGDETLPSLEWHGAGDSNYRRYALATIEQELGT